MLPSILVCGNDPSLLFARRLVLEHAGFRVETVLGLSGLPEQGRERIVLCSSLSESEQTQAILSAQARCPGAKILVVCSEEREGSETVLNMPIFGKAEALIENVRRLSQ